MKVMLINGSPHEKGCTYTALAECAKTLHEAGIDTEFFWIGKKPVQGCVACGGCARLGRCAFNDPVNEFIEKAQTADGFIDCDGKPLAISTPFTKMLVHKLRAEEDAILVGRVTDEREHPQLNVREWCGKSPVRFVLSRSEERGKIWVNSFEELFRECREQLLQSLIVEGGRKTLQSFIDQDLWDEIRVETADGFHLTADSSTPAPLLPPNATLFLQQGFGSNIISYYKK